MENSEDGPRICYQQGRISGSRIFATKIATVGPGFKICKDIVQNTYSTALRICRNDVKIWLVFHTSSMEKIRGHRSERK